MPLVIHGFLINSYFLREAFLRSACMSTQSLNTFTTSVNIDSGLNYLVSVSLLKRSPMKSGRRFEIHLHRNSSYPCKRCSFFFFAIRSEALEQVTYWVVIS